VLLQDLTLFYPARDLFLTLATERCKFGLGKDKEKHVAQLAYPSLNHFDTHCARLHPHLEVGKKSL
jgi:hypothetical protein